MRSIDHKHPKGTKYTPNELRSRRDAWYALVASGHASQTTDKLRTQTRDAIEATERPFVVIDGFNVELTTLADAPDIRVPDALAGKDKGLYVTRFAVQPRWKNGGDSPTRNMTIQVDWRGPGGTLPIGASYEYRNPRQPFFLAPKVTELSEFIEITGANALINDGNDVISPRAMMFIWGRADYEDTIGRPHFTQWCYNIRFERHRGEKLRAGFVQWGDYNGTNETTKST